MRRPRRRSVPGARLAALATLAIMRLAAPAPAQQAPAPPGDTVTASAEATVRALYRLISFRPGERIDTAALRRLFLPQAVLALRSSPTAFAVWTVDSFVVAFARADTSATLSRTGFHETVVRLHATPFRDIAHVFVLFEAQVNDASRPARRGVDSFELVRREGRWWIVGVTNDVLVPDARVPAEIGP